VSKSQVVVTRFSAAIVAPLDARTGAPSIEKWRQLNNFRPDISFAPRNGSMVEAYAMSGKPGRSRIATRLTESLSQIVNLVSRLDKGRRN
jgi:hypothetical protein